jgi:hypothetical protein
MTCVFDGLFLGSKYALMEIVSMKWVTKMRERALERVLAQDKLGSMDTPRRQANHTLAYQHLPGADSRERRVR